MAQRFLKLVFLGIIFFVLLATVNAACNIDISNTRVELRNDTDSYAEDITALNNSYIDIRTSFDIDEVLGTNCPSEVRASALIYRRQINGSWVQFDSTTTKNATLNENSFTFTWDNEFRASDSYSEYKVVATIKDSLGNTLDVVEAYATMQSGNCSGIELTAYDFVINEGNTTTKTFRVRNTTNTDFTIEGLRTYYSNSSLVADTDLYYSDVVPKNSSVQVEVRLLGNYVSYDSRTTGTFALNGKLGSRSCTETQIGRKTFDIQVKNVSTTDSTEYVRKTDCEDLEINVHNFSINENQETTQVFYLENDSTKRFQITDVSVTNNGVQLYNYYNEKYAHPGEIADIVLKGSAPNVFSSRTYENTIKVKGMFSDGKTCTFENIQKKTFTVSVIDNQASTINLSSCNDFSINVSESIAIENFGTIPFTITNGTSKRADIYVESNIDVTPTLISLPANSAISRELSVSLLGYSGEIVLRSVVEGCNFNSKRITITNKARGELASLSMNIDFSEDENKATIITEINNPTTKIFRGVLNFDLPQGYFSSNKEVVITPGKNTIVSEISKTNNTSSGRGTITFRSENGEIKQEFNIGGETFSGMFLLSGGIYNLGLILLLIVVVLLVVGIISSITNKPEKKQEWQD